MKNLTREIILKKAKETFATEEAANNWMKTPLLTLDNKTPSQSISAGDGKRVLDILDKIKFGYGC